MTSGTAEATGGGERPRIRLEPPTAPDGGFVDPPTFLSIMGALPTGVTVVTTLDGRGDPTGLTCSAMCSLSKEPPLLLVCIHRRSRVLGAILERDRFLVNVLRDERESTSSLFASTVADRFSSVVWRPSPSGGLPWMPEDTIAYVECQVAAAIEAGDHTLLIGAMIDGAASRDACGPLMYWRRRYGRWPDEEDPFTAALTMATEG
ncbi:flavin reductase family protein [Actinomadura kijaniata]|uniref:flavin reductase family protein n=1 Tax=Actinomadura kijaniata TaxID=46161 RepID=UPI003F1A763B